MWFKEVDDLRNWKQEHQAEEFIVWLTVSAREDYGLLYMEPSEMARRDQITEALATVRLGA